MGLPKDSGFDLYSKRPTGPRNLITDVAGVTVGQVTVEDESRDIHTGVTAVLPHQGDLFHEKLAAGVAVLNGFGKSAGLVQIEELGTLETPIILTNTLSVGTGLNALVKYMLERNDDIGLTTGTVNCVVTECNDGTLNDIRGLHVTEEHVRQALDNTGETFEEGAVGGGTGMCCLGLKGGIGSASRVVEGKDASYTVGALVMSNFGEPGNLVIGGVHYDTAKCKRAPLTTEEKKDKGSIIMLLATDAPLNERQLTRLARRSAMALGRVGSYSGNGSGDIAIAFSTANRIPHKSESDTVMIKTLLDDKIDGLFEAGVEAVEEAIISSLYHAKTTVGICGHKRYGLVDYIETFEK